MTPKAPAQASVLSEEEIAKHRHVFNTAQHGDYLDNAFCWGDVEDLLATIDSLTQELAQARADSGDWERAANETARTRVEQEAEYRAQIRKLTADLSQARAEGAVLQIAVDDVFMHWSAGHDIHRTSLLNENYLRAKNAATSTAAFLAEMARLRANQRTVGTREVCNGCGDDAREVGDGNGCPGFRNLNQMLPCPIPAREALSPAPVPTAVDEGSKSSNNGS